MKHLIKLMLLAALAFPTWPNAAAQDAVTHDESVAPRKVLVEGAKTADEAKALRTEAKKEATPSALQENTKGAKSEDIKSDVLEGKRSHSDSREASGQPKKAPSRPNRAVISDYDPITVADGTETSEYVPFYGYYYSTEGAYSQMIYPSTMMPEAIKGKTIYAITFYAPNGIQFSTASGNGELTAYLMNTTQSYFSSASGATGSDYKTATETPQKGDTELTFYFDDGLKYTGNSLLVDLTATTAGTSGTTNFVGSSQSQYSSYVYVSSNTSGRVQFLPKMTIWYKDEMTATPSHLDFGKVNCGGSQSANQTVTITNNNSTPITLTWDFTGPQAAAFKTTETGESYTLAAGATKTFSVYCKPGNLSGNLSANFNVYVDGGDNTYCRIALAGKGVAQYAATVNPTTVNIGEVLVSEAGTATVTLTNTGTQAIEPVATAPDKAVFSVSSTDDGSLPSGEKRVYTVTLVPTDEQEYSGSFYIKDEANGINLKVNLKGKGVEMLAPYVAKTVTSGGDGPTQEVCDGTQTSNSTVPFYGLYFDYGTGSQMIYPAGKLGLEDGDIINSITFYTYTSSTENVPGELGNVTVTMRVGETTKTKVTEATSANYTALSDMDTNRAGLTNTTSVQLATGSPSTTITLAEPYTYNGGNLIIDFVVPVGTSSYKSCTMTGEAADLGSSCYYKRSSSSSKPDYDATTATPQSFLPKMTLGVTRAHESTTEYVRIDHVDWGNQNVNSGTTFYEQTVTVHNPNSTAVTASLSIPETEPFYFADNTSSNTKTIENIPAGGTSSLTLFFNPTAAASYTGYLTISADGHTSKTRLTGLGLKSGEIVTRDSSFFASLPEYTWKDSDGNTHKSNLTEVATDPDQIIALMSEVYTNQNIPGNKTRGYTTGGVREANDVYYSGVGTITRGSGYSSVGDYTYNPSYGWKIPGDVKLRSKNYSYGSYSSATAYAAYLDTTQYVPAQEGVTLLLVEMVDNYDAYKDDEVIYKDSNNDWAFHTYSDDPYENLRYYIAHSIKSVRILTESKRTGSKDDYSSGTLFKIDADKLNKYFLLAKGQLRWIHNSYYAYWYGSSTYLFKEDLGGAPCYMYSASSSTTFMNQFADALASPPFFHMFEQFSPVSQASGSSANDLYASMVNMESFEVEHDCMTVPYRYHQFQMYGDDSEAADCQDVRDMMFFVPDYRMMYDSDRDLGTLQNYVNYNTQHRPTMGLYVIHQDEIPEGTKIELPNNKALYKHQLQWKSNLDDFLPSDDQYYELWELVVDEFGVESYVPVYERNADGSYVMVNGAMKPVILDRNTAVTVTSGDDKGKLQYLNVYVDMKPGSQMKTYVIRGRDKDGFLSLQMSNEQSIFIPGTDASEMMFLSSATHYSRYNPQNEKNCYSNKLKMKTNPRSFKESYFAGNAQIDMTLTRSWNEKNGDQTVVKSETVAKLYANRTQRKVYVVMSNQADESEYPAGMSDAAGAPRAGYHANPITDQNNMVFEMSVANGYANFDFDIWDNFVVDVSKNEHPGQYTYELTFNTFNDIPGTTNTDDPTHAHSNEYPVPVYKTDSKISEPRTLAQVLGDKDIKDEMKPGDVEFQEQVQLSSKQNILRYDVYRWDELEDRYIVDAVYGDDNELDLPPTGIAGNQGDFYTVSMNATGTEDYYVGDNVGVNTTNTTNWATFVDYYPTNEENEVGSYVYAPVVELFTKGYKVGSTTEKRTDYNTYGGPQQKTAVGRLKVEPYYPTSSDQDGTRALMSDYKWQDEYGDWCSYYNIFLNFEALDVPEGYELYKVRAWRKVDPSILDEPIESRYQARIEGIDANGWYLYEDMNFGDPIKSDGTMTMSCSNLKLNPLVAEGDNPKGLFLGERSVSIAKPQNPDATDAPEALFDVDTNNQNQVDGEMRATFGAVRLKTSENDPYGSLNLLEAKFKVRAYFTRESNPLIAGKTDNAPFYVIGNSANSTSWDPAAPLGTLYSYDGTTYAGTVTVNDTKDGNDTGYGYLSFANKKGSWSEVESGNRFGWNKNDNYYVNESDYGKELNLTSTGGAEPGNFRIPAGTYTMTVKVANGTPSKLVITKGALRAPRREAQMTGSDFDYYVAEGECEFKQLASDGVVTGISAVKQDVNREVVGVSYVNTIGQVSSTPWQGVNMVVTRYSDGSTTTKKVIK